MYINHSKKYLMINKNLILNYKKTGFLIIKNFFNKKDINKIIKKILLNTKKKLVNYFFMSQILKRLEELKIYVNFLMTQKS